MGNPIQQSMKPSGRPAQRGVENRQDPSPASNSGRPDSEQDGAESMVAEHGSNNGGSDPTNPRARDAPLAQDTPRSSNQDEDLVGIGAWTDKDPSAPA